MNDYREFINWIESQKKLSFYGAGYIAELLHSFLDCNGGWDKVKNIFVSRCSEADEFHGKKLLAFSEGAAWTGEPVLVAVSERLQEEIKAVLENSGVPEYVCISDDLIAEIDRRLKVDTELKRIVDYAKVNRRETKEDILFLSPPYWDVYSPFSAVPCLVAKLMEAGYQTKQIDLGIHCIRHVIQEQWNRIVECCLSEEFYNETFLNYRENCYASHQEYVEDMWFFRGGSFDIDRIKAIYEGLNPVQKRVIDEFYTIAYSMEVTYVDFDLCEELEECIYTWNGVAFLRHLTQTNLKEIFVELPDVVGLSVTSTCQFIPGYLLAKIIKQIKPETKIILGGSCADLFAKSDYKNKRDIKKYFDYIIVGEGETALTKLMEYIKSGNRGNLEAIPNLLLVDDTNEIRYTEQIVENVRELPLANYDGLDLSLYLAPRVILPYQTSRGCHYGQCAFCNHDEKYRHNYRSKDIKTVVQELLELAKKYQVQDFQFVDEAIRPDCFAEMVEEMDKHPEFRTIQWFYYSRVSRAYTEELLRKAKRNGCSMVMFGVETLNQRLLKHIKKGINAETSKYCLRLFHECGIKTHAWLMCNLPSETLEEAKEDMEQVRELDDVIDMFSVGPFCLYKNTDMYSNPEKYGIVSVNDKDPLRFQSQNRGELIDKERMLDFYENEYHGYQIEKFSKGNRYTLYFE